MTLGIVLAGGRSSRFGRDKLAVPLADGRTLLAHAIEPLAGICDRVALTTADADEPREGLPPGLLMVSDPEPFGGPVVGLLAGLVALAVAGGSPHEVVLLAAGDMPTMRPDVLGLLAATLAADPTADAARLELGARGTDPHTSALAVMPVAVRAGPAAKAARRALADDDRRLRGFLERLRTIVVPALAWLELDPQATTTRDIDRPGDLEAP